MKNISQSETTQNKKIRQNRLKMRQNLKLNRTEHEKKKKYNDSALSESINQNKSQIHVNHIKVLNRVGLVQKEYIQGQFEDAYELKEKIGEGAHATVYRCIQKSTRKVFAVKVTKQGDEELIEGSRLQFKILKNLDHQNVMKAEAFYTDRVKMTTYLVCELCNYPQLAIYLRNRNKKFLSQAQATTIVTSILQTLQYLHRNGVCHRDIKPENILYDSETRKIKIIDFDCATHKKESDSRFEMWTKTGSLHYQAPECFQSTIYDEKIDIWATGIIAYELVTGNIPFKSSYYNRMIKMITQDKIQIDGLNVSQDFKNLLKSLLEKDPTKRFTAAKSLRLPAVLKCEQCHTIKIEDDFDIYLSNSSHGSPKSCKEISLRYSDYSTCGEDSPKPLLKFFCFVSEISEI